MKPKKCSTGRKFKESPVLITPYKTLVTSGAYAPHTSSSEGGAAGHKTLKHRTPQLRSPRRLPFSLLLKRFSSHFLKPSMMCTVLNVEVKL